MLSLIKTTTLYEIKAATEAGKIYEYKPRKARVNGMIEPMTDMQHQFYTAVEKVVNLFGEKMPHKSYNKAATEEQLAFIQLPVGLYQSKDQILEDLIRTGALRCAFYTRRRCRSFLHSSTLQERF